jgi:sulfoxide reductase heme-binding subunit YedZ
VNGIAWYADRAAGMTALVLLTASVCLGIALAGRVRSQRWPAFAIQEVHRYLGLLTGVFIGIHGLAILLDSYVPYSLKQLLVPGTAPSRTMAVAAGVVGTELLAALAITNRFRTRLSFKFWRRAHYLNFAVWALSLVHGVTAGTDTHAGWAQLLYLVSAASVTGAIAWRVARRRTAGPWAVRLAPVIGGLVAAESRSR